MACHDLATIIHYLQNREAGSERPTNYAHLNQKCPICLKKVEWVEMVLATIVRHRLFKRLSIENLDWLEKILTTASEDRSFEFPEETIAAIVAKFEEQIAAGLRPLLQSFSPPLFFYLHP